MSGYPAVHEVTTQWWRMLPQCYREADEVTPMPVVRTWTALNSDPTFSASLDGWSVAATEQTDTKVTVTTTRAFSGVSQSQTVTVQVWFTLGDVDRATVTVPGVAPVVVNGPVTQQESRLVFTAPLDGRFNVTLTLEVPDVPGDETAYVDGVVVTTGAPALFDDLPTPGDPKAFGLVRFMDGAGRVGAVVRDVINQLEDGTYTDPARAPETGLRWLAMMLGVAEPYRSLPPAKLRPYLVDVLAGQAPAGSRQAIVNAARTFLTGDRQATVITGSAPFTLLLLVRSTEVPGEDVNALTARIVASGVVPAGHVLVAKPADPSWDAWSAAAGTTWADKEARIRTWVESDAAGVILT